MTRGDDPLEPHAALRQAGGTNEQDLDRASSHLAGELNTARARIAEVEEQAEALRADVEAYERQRQALATELGSTQAAAAAEREKAQVSAHEVQKAIKQASEALRRAKRAEAAIHRIKAIPGLRGRLLRWLAGDIPLG
ncbi:MAG: hypothetical protein M0Z85_11675 [Gammaproteobacteria bacterium]|nr:hypothetical protein [Gammaproteobacteria bacterium]